MSGSSLFPEFLDSVDGRIFALAHIPAEIRKPSVLVVPPFAEEMNKSRRLITDLSLALAAEGVPVIRFDLFGTGDSDGEFAQATWDRWIRDIQDVIHWADRNGWHIGSILGIRLGSAIAINAATAIEGMPRHAIFWQPVFDGRQFLNQFLRLGVAASLADGPTGVSIASLKEQLQAGENVEIAGYELSARLAAQINMDFLEAQPRRWPEALDWIEVARSGSSEVSPAATKEANRIRAAGTIVNISRMTGQPFWSSTELVSMPELIAKTKSILLAPR